MRSEGQFSATFADMLGLVLRLDGVLGRGLLGRRACARRTAALASARPEKDEHKQAFLLFSPRPPSRCRTSSGSRPTHITVEATVLATLTPARPFSWLRTRRSGRRRTCDDTLGSRGSDGVLVLLPVRIDCAIAPAPTSRETLRRRRAPRRARAGAFHDRFDAATAGFVRHGDAPTAFKPLPARRPIVSDQWCERAAHGGRAYIARATLFLGRFGRGGRHSSCARARVKHARYLGRAVPPLLNARTPVTDKTLNKSLHASFECLRCPRPMSARRVLLEKIFRARC